MSNHNPPTNGFDKRKHQINRKGRPKTFDQLRNLAQQIAQEVIDVKNTDTGEVKKMTVVDTIMRKWASSKDPRLVQAFIEYAYGKVPTILNGDQEGGPVILTVIYDKKKTDA